ncbi:MAG: hypothetical protein J2P30_07675 [Actinobacteria bacterium]|nr:hypothetical protein [Actinomycetota bacterium]
MSIATARRPAAISESSRRKLVRLAWASSLIISGLVMLAVGIFIGNAASNRITKETRGIT